MGPMIFSFLVSFTTLSLSALVTLSSSDELFYHNCGNSFKCGSIAGVGYPFHGYEEPEYCGYPGLVLACKNNIPTIRIVNVEYRVLDIDQTTKTMRIAREDMMGDVCKLDLVNTTLDNSPFEFASSYTNLNFMYGCHFSVFPNLIQIPSCNISGNEVFLLPETGFFNLGCESKITVPVEGWDMAMNLSNLGQAIQSGFKVRWKVDSEKCRDCAGSGGRCGYDFVTNRTTCYCPNPPYTAETCSTAAGALPTTAPTVPGMLLCL
ncbi:Leaf rust 10 disease-resistance locus receptor-like protein kinase [Actinidia chinensis var. chinensis]|uniref:non-specific serine/threonine protein kinase n=1 Tax=Actinidia chinensis var. chinensis TaxID=1590841 RepID=A0A2R6RUB9_ACTCC|nr:Leaf rust 10 disease-resistance locus receptor-like protein kinase [Actinidia chinensis var. chinensis]